MNNTINYRPEIDALKGLSIILVVLFHLEFPFFKSGFLGVDIFFVISGYLIAQVFYNKNISIKRYLIGRIKRIFPAYFFILLFLTLILLIFLEPNESFLFSKDILYSIPFLSNIWFSEIVDDYFNSHYRSSILNFWSLSVEIQFYLFAIFLIIFLKIKKKIYIFSLIFFGLLSLLIIQFGGNLKTSSPFIEQKLFFFNTPTFLDFYSFYGRLWEFLLGMLFFEFKKKNVLENSKLVLFGLILILISIFIIPTKNFHPGLITLLPVLGTGLILINYKKNNFFNFLFNNKFIIFFGKLSYSLYLIHYPLILFEKKYLNLNFEFTYVIIILLSISLSYLSYKFIENPLRQENNFNLASKIIIFLIILSASINYFNVNTLGYKKKFFQINKKYNNILLESYGKKLEDRDKLLNKLESTTSSKDKILVIGDSVAEDLFMLLKFDNELQTSFIDYDLKKYSFQNKNEEKLKYLISDIINYINNENVTNILVSYHYTPRDYDEQLNHFISFVNILKDYGIPIIYVRGSPVFVQDKNNYLSHRDISLKIIDSSDAKLSVSEIEKIAYQKIDENYFKTANKINVKLDENNIKSFDLFDFFCDLNASKCQIVDKFYKSYYMDNFHLSTEGIKFFSKKINLMNILSK